MPRPLLKQLQNQTLKNNILSATKNQKRQSQQMDKMKLDRLLRKKRSREYIQSIKKLDAGGHVHNQHKVNEIIDTIRNEFPDLEINSLMLGIVSICYLGEPYEVHTLDITGEIIEHYKSGQVLPGVLEKARSIAIHGGYEFIEVYTDCCRAVSSDGSVSVIPC